MASEQHDTARVYRGAARTGRGRARRVVTLFVLLSLSGACAQDPRKQTRQELQTLSSWAATLHLLGEAWLERSVPSRYAQQTLHEARQTLQEEAQTIQQSSSIPADARAALIGHAQQLDRLAGGLSEEVQTGDPTDTPQVLTQVAQEQQALADLARGVGAR
ncbi:MAG: hypothetical protein ABR563_19775 [Pyrinomonadaceae bacterium]